MKKYMPENNRNEIKQEVQKPAKIHLSRFLKSDLILGVFLFCITFIVYQPAWNGKLLWDDDSHITRTDLRSIGGLERIWTQLGATQQYYPFTHSVFWLEYHLWGDSTTGYHLVNILLHFLSALLLICILRRLAIPGAWLLAAIFTLHPVQVESVAWITELKNTLSGVFFFSALLVYLKFDSERKRKLYVIAIGLFLLGLMSKSVIATLPVSLLAIFWWKRGKINWKQDIVPLTLFFVVGIAYGLFTAWMEKKFIGAQGGEFTFSFIERCLIAGRVIWFYLSKIFLPINLIFIYPRWNVSQAVWWQYAFPAAAFVLTGGLWIIRKYSRAPLAAFICFTAAIFPVMGFFNVYPFQFSFVANHFIYLAIIGPCIIAVVGAGRIIDKVWNNNRILRSVAAMLLVLILSFLSWKQSPIYSNSETLFQTVLEKNNDCCLAHNNLGFLLANSGQIDDAIIHFQKALETCPNFPEAHFNLGIQFAHIGRIDEAIFQYQKALEANPSYFEACNNLANAFIKTGQINEAISFYRKALDINPDFAEAHYNLAVILSSFGQEEEALIHYKKALENKPNYLEAHIDLGAILLKAGRIDESIYHFQKALEINPNKISTLQKLAGAYEQKGQMTDAIGFVEKALEIAKSVGDELLIREITVNLERLNKIDHLGQQGRQY